MSGCGHAWVHERQGAPLTCANCLLPWPGEQLPDPVPRHEGYGARGPSWKSRVAAMVSELNADAA